MTTSIVRATTVIAVVVVALIAAVVSYSHMQQLASTAGEHWRSWLIPLSIDGLVVAASMVLLTRRRTGLPGGPLAWGALGAGVVASLAANMADARPDLTAVLVAGWPAVAFAVAFELLLQQRRAEDSAATQPQPAPPDQAPAVAESYPPAPVIAPVAANRRAAVSPIVARVAAAVAAVSPVEPVPVAVQGPAPTASLDPDDRQPPASPSQVSAAGDPATVGDDDLVQRVRQLLADTDTDPGAKPPGRREIARRLNVSEHRARLALELVGATTGAALNGASGGAEQAGHQSGSR